MNPNGSGLIERAGIVNTNTTSPFASFWMGGYDGADHVNGAGEKLDMVGATGHDRRLDADYRAARRLGIRCVRESIGWRLTERPDGSLDLSRVMHMALAAQRQGVQILWTLMHHGVPPDLTLLDDALIPRFARFAGEVARTLAPLCRGPRIYTPINEISFLAWAASATSGMGPAGLHGQADSNDSRISGYLVKQRLVKAALAGMAAMRAADPEARFLHVEPVLHVAPSDGDDPEHCALARRIAAYQWQTFDLLAGRMDPGLGGHPTALDWIGLNHHHTSQWEVPSEKRLPWPLRDPRRQPLSALLHEVWRRYRRPMVLADTGHTGMGRAAWLHEIAGEARRVREAGVPLEGVCLYPLLDRPDWNDTATWNRSGLWHVQKPEARCLNRSYARALLSWRDNPPRPAGDRPGLLVLLPCAWEDWRAPREALLRKLPDGRPVCLLEPPRPAATDALLRCHTVAPGAELLIVHGRGARGWASAPTAEQLALVRDAVRRAGRERWVCWLAGWRADAHPDWWRELQGDGVILQPDPAAPPQGDVLRHARGRLHAPLAEPPLPRRATPRSYEAQEVARLLEPIPAPRTWLVAPQHVDARRLSDLAVGMPAQHWLVDAEPPDAQPSPPNLHWLGRVHESMHPALAAAVQRTVPWGGPPGWATLDARRPTTDDAPALQAALRTFLAALPSQERAAGL